jgi:hypothetical protein
MTDLVVVRFLGDKEGDDIVDDLLATDAAALSRGRAELDGRSTAIVSREIDVPYEVGVELGQLVEVTDELQGETYKGKITSLSYSAQVAEALIGITMDVPSDFFV